MKRQEGINCSRGILQYAPTTHVKITCLVIFISLFSGCSDSLEKAFISSSFKRAARIDAGKCSSCGTCFNTCPQKAITETETEDGFIYLIDPEKCNSCGECIKVCPDNAISYKTAGVE
jgi:NAD-dependent dihydropyrimidine dehydrogenase PreA subunit